MPDAPILGGGQEAHARRRRVRRAVQRPARARGRGGRARRAPPGHARDHDPRHGPRRRRQAVAPEGHRPRPRRLDPRSPLWTGGGIVFGPSPRHYTVKVNRKARRAALRCALSLHAERGSLFGLDAGGFDAPSTKQAAEPARTTAAAAPCWSCSADDEAAAAKSFRNLAARERAARRRRAAWPTSSAPRRSCFAGRARRAHRARARARRRRWPDGPQPGDHPPRRLREVLRAGDGRQVHVPRARRRAQDADQAGRRGAVRRQRARGPHLSACPPSPSAAATPPGRTRAWKKAVVQVRAGDTIPIFQGLEADL